MHHDVLSLSCVFSVSSRGPFGFKTGCLRRAAVLWVLIQLNQPPPNGERTECTGKSVGCSFSVKLREGAAP